MGNLSVKTNIMFYVFTESKDLLFLPFYFKSLWLELDFLSFHKTVQIGLLLEPYFKFIFNFSCSLSSIYQFQEKSWQRDCVIFQFSVFSVAF